jgi:hypothetical protein
MLFPACLKSEPHRLPSHPDALNHQSGEQLSAFGLDLSRLTVCDPGRIDEARHRYSITPAN